MHTMANPFATSRWFHRIGHVTNTSFWRIMPTPTGLGVLTTTGRRTGKQRQRAIRAVRVDDHVYAAAMLGRRCDWVYNIRAHPEVSIKLGGRTYNATARELVDQQERQQAEHLYVPNAGWFDYFDYANLMWSFPTREKLLRAHEQWLASGIPVVFDIQR
jgi:deazaflavin-dependent oxidoreductase (nitroreductase family)